MLLETVRTEVMNNLEEMGRVGGRVQGECAETPEIDGESTKIEGEYEHFMLILFVLSFTFYYFY